MRDAGRRAVVMDRSRQESRLGQAGQGEGTILLPLQPLFPNSPRPYLRSQLNVELQDFHSAASLYRC